MNDCNATNMVNSAENTSAYEASKAKQNYKANHSASNCKGPTDCR